MTVTTIIVDALARLQEKKNHDFVGIDAKTITSVVSLGHQGFANALDFFREVFAQKASLR